MSDELEEVKERQRAYKKKQDECGHDDVMWAKQRVTAGAVTTYIEIHICQDCEKVTDLEEY